MELIYEKLSHKLIDLTCEVDRQIDFGFLKNIYSNAFEKILNNNNT